MPDLPQYPLPQQSVQQIGQTASNVPPNILAGVGPGIAQGFGMGLQQRQVQAQELERQTQLMQAQAAMQQAKRENDLKALEAVGQQYERLAKIHPDTAFEYYKNTMAPLNSVVLADHGIQADFQSEANPMHETADSVKRIQDAVTGLADGSIDQPTFQKIMAREQAGHNVGEYLQKRIDEGSKAGNAIQENVKNQSSLLQNAKAEFDKQLSNRSGGLGLQDAKVNQAGHLRTMINQNSKIDPKTGQVNYNFPENIQGELVLGLANLVSGSNVGNVEELKSLTPKTARGDWAHVMSYWTGAPLPATPQAFAKQLVDQIDRQGETAQQMRDTYHSQFAASLDPTLNEDKRNMLTKAGRGVRFEDYRNQGQEIQRKGKDGKIYTYKINPKTGKYE